MISGLRTSARFSLIRSKRSFADVFIVMVKWNVKKKILEIEPWMWVFMRVGMKLGISLIPHGYSVTQTDHF